MVSSAFEILKIYRYRRLVQKKAPLAMQTKSWFGKQCHLPILLCFLFQGAFSFLSFGETEAFFHRLGQDIIDPDGKRYLIRGVNVSCWLYQENYVIGGAQTASKETAARIKSVIGEDGYFMHIKDMMDSFLVVGDVRLMQKMGINCVRLGFDAVLFNDDATKNLFYRSIDRLLPVFRECNISILPIMMVPPKAPDKLWCTGYVKGDTMLWDSPSAKRRTIEIWSEIAAHYRDERMILGYDLLGEPAVKMKRAKEIAELYRDITAGIRKQDPNHMIVYEGNNHAIDLDVLSAYDDMLDKNGCYSFHLYTWFGLKMEKYLPLFMKNARLCNRPVFCGEWGINRISAIKHQVNLMNAEEDMDGWIIYMWKALELPTGKAERRRPPYYGNWFFIPFDKLKMSLITFEIDGHTRDVIDWMSKVKKAKVPTPEDLRATLKKISTTVYYRNCKPGEELIRVLGFTLVNP